MHLGWIKTILTDPNGCIHTVSLSDLSSSISLSFVCSCCCCCSIKSSWSKSSCLRQVACAWGWLVIFLISVLLPSECSLDTPIVSNPLVLFSPTGSLELLCEFMDTNSGLLSMVLVCPRGVLLFTGVPSPPICLAWDDSVPVPTEPASEATANSLPGFKGSEVRSAFPVLSKIRCCLVLSGVSQRGFPISLRTLTGCLVWDGLKSQLCEYNPTLEKHSGRIFMAKKNLYPMNHGSYRVDINRVCLQTCTWKKRSNQYYSKVTDM